MAEEKKISGPEKAAILILSLGEELASEVMKHLGAGEVQKISALMTKIDGLPKERLALVSKEFRQEMESKVAFAGNDYVKNVLTRALGSDRADMIIDRIVQGSEGGGLEALKWMEPKLVADLVRNEHPQTIAVVMVHLEPEHAGQVMSYLSPKLRSNVLIRVATLESIGPDAMRELEETIKQELSGSLATHNRNIGGIKAAAEILNQMDSSSETVILSEIEKTNSELAERIEEQMFVFADLGRVDDRGIQTLMKDVSSDQLVVALKVADDKLKDKFFRNMSERAREMLKEDMEAKGPVKLSEVEKVQQEIIKIARRLEGEGKLVIEGKGGEEVLV